jgi:signal transduction histidine kinase
LSPGSIVERAVSINTGRSDSSTGRAFGFRGARNVAALLALVAAGIADLATGAALASVLFYVPILLPLAFAEAWGACLAYALVAGGIALSADLIHDPGRTVLLRPYGDALVDFAVFALITCAVSLLVRERRSLRGSRRALQEKTLELHDRQRRLEAALREVARLQGEARRREYQAEIGDAVFATAHELERPLASAAVYVKELTRLIARAHVTKTPQSILDDLSPLLEKLEERIQSMDRLLREIRDPRGPRPRT